MFLNVWKAVFLGVGLAAAAAGAQTPTRTPSRIRGPIKLQQTVRLQGNTVWRARHAWDQGPAPAGLPMHHMLLLLKRSPAQQMALEDLLAAQREQDAPQYHHWLTAAEFGARFGPSATDVATIEHWLQGQGFQVDEVAPGGLVIAFSGTAATVQKALHTTIHRYEVRQPGQVPVEHVANATDPAIPAALAPVVAGVVSLGNFFKTPMAHLLGMGTARRAAAGDPQPDLNFKSPNGQIQRAMVPGDFQTIYNVPTGTLDGAGETIAVIGRSDVAPNDFQEARQLFLRGSTGTLNTILATPSDDPGFSSEDDRDEATLDVEWAGAAAPNATIDLVVAASVVRHTL